MIPHVQRQYIDPYNKKFLEMWDINIYILPVYPYKQLEPFSVLQFHTEE